MSDYGPSLTACKLYRKQSKTGGTYFAGRMGNLKVALLKSKETADDGAEIWSLVYSQAPERPRDSQYSALQSRPTEQASPEPVRTRAEPIDDSKMPF